MTDTLIMDLVALAARYSALGREYEEDGDDENLDDLTHWIASAISTLKTGLSEVE